MASAVDAAPLVIFTYLALPWSTGLGQGFTDNASVNVFASNEEGSELLAISEPVLASYRIDRDTLASKSRENFQDKV